MTLSIRPMTPDDVEAVREVVSAANDEADRKAGQEPSAPTAQQREQFFRGTRRFITEDAAGAWVAVDDDGVVGMAEAIRRGGFWGLSMLFVHPRAQSQGIGRQLLDRTLDYARGSDVRMIMTSEDPRALRRYALAGLQIHPAVKGVGMVDRTAIPVDLKGRTGSADDLDLVAAVDTALLGRSRAADAEFVLGNGATLEIVDDGAHRGFALHRDAHPNMLGATDEQTAAALLWRILEKTTDKTEIYCLTAAQDWAVRVCLAARLAVSGSGPLFISGMDHPAGPWLPSGWYF
ncbi:MAG: GNAT family N-acetyltransferase [Nitriliruptorales bacterium]|nr:GNAT family N-acetyltransferase [Nitriliruptorales bacterium]